MTAKISILLVDDDAEITALLGEYLVRFNFDVHCASDGASMRAQLASHKVDLVVLDVMLPDINGKEVCQRVRMDSALDGTQIICISGMVEQDKIADLKAAGANEFMQKPFEIDSLIDRMCKLLDVEPIPAGTHRKPQ